MNKKYKIIFDINHHPKGISTKQIENKFGCDKLLIGTLSNQDKIELISKDGNSGTNLSNEDIFLIWLEIAKTLEYPICQQVVDAVYDSQKEKGEE